MTANPAWAKTGQPRDQAYGDGSTGSFSSGGVTLAAPAFYTTLALASGTFNQACFHPYGSVSITINSPWATTNGNNASGSTGGASAASGSLPGSTAGGSGVTGNNTGVVGDSSRGLTGVGGGGGNTGGTTNASGANTVVWSNYRAALLGLANSTTALASPFVFPFGGQGVTNAGRGSGNGTNAGGGAGSAGGAIFMASPTITGSSTITGTGGNGGNGAAGTAGGGGGGGGSGCLIAADSPPSITPTLTAGSKGTSSTGGNGGDGTAGTTSAVTVS